MVIYKFASTFAAKKIEEVARAREPRLVHLLDLYEQSLPSEEWRDMKIMGKEWKCVVGRNSCNAQHRVGEKRARSERCCSC